MARKKKAVREDRQAQAHGVSSAQLRAAAVATPQRRSSLKRAWQRAKEPPHASPVAEAGTVLAKKGRLSVADPGAEASELDAAVNSALKIHSELLQLFSSGKEWCDACEMAEKRTAELYSELLDLFRVLFPASAADRQSEESIGDRAYSVAEIQGRLVEGGKEGVGVPLAERMAQLRSESAEGLARDALCVVLAVLASRKDMCWLEAHDTEVPVRGYFAHALANAHSSLRISMLNSIWGPRPASLLVTSRVPLRTALENTDSGGPLKEMKPEMWLGGQACETLQFAMQELEDSDDLGAFGTLIEERALVRTLVPEPKLRELLLSQVEVLAVEAYAALAPRDAAAAEGLSEVIQGEFLLLLRKAKADGVPVLLQLGGRNPHLLARKVYLRPAFTELGLRCGYLRWRPSAEGPWAREQKAEDRVCLGLQLP